VSTAIDRSMAHFRASNARSIAVAGGAFAAGNWQDVREVLRDVVSSATVASISALVNTSRPNLNEFVTKAGVELDSKSLKFLFGTSLVGIGAGALAETAGLAVALGVTVLTIEVVGVVLLLWGLSIALPILWQRALEKMSEAKQSLF
jgi:hypothetical protein